MKTIRILALTTALSLALSSCDANRELRDRVETLALQQKSDRARCDQARSQESSHSSRFRALLVELSELRADKEWDGIVQSGEAGTKEMLIQAKRTMNDPDYESKRDLDIVRLEQQIESYQQDDARLGEQRKAACDALLESNEKYLEARKALQQVLNQKEG